MLYIGKANHLRNRVRSYFQQRKHQTAKNVSMVKRIADVEWLVVRNEVEALLTEANLIKQHQPHYNVSLKDDKSFPYILISKNEKWPQLTKHRGKKTRSGHYFGPVSYTHLTLPPSDLV